MTPEEMFKTAQALRSAGVLIFERRCWDATPWDFMGDGKRLAVTAHGCGSYFRWAHGEKSLCPFCGHQWDYSQKFPYTNPELYPLTLSYTGEKGTLSKEEEDLIKMGFHEVRV